MAQRVLIYTNHFYPENFKVNEVSEMLSNDGLEVTVITGIPNYPDGKIAKGYGYFKNTTDVVKGVKVKRLWLIPRGSGSKLRLVINYLSYFTSCIFYTLYIGLFKKKYDVIFVHHTSPILIAISPIIYKWLRKPKMILWDLDMWPDTLVALDIIKSKKVILFLETLVKWIYKQYDKVLIGSNSFASKAKERVADYKIDYFPNWAEDVFTQKNQVQPNNNPQFPEGFSVMYAGNIGEAQDFGNVFNAMKILKNEAINWLIVGDGRWLKQLKEKVSQSGLSDKVTYYGNNPLQTMPYFFSKADVMFFSLQDKEIFSKTVPAKLQAYMASAKPIVGMISGEGNQIIKEANCGLSVNSGDYIGFADAILEMKTNKQLLLQYGQNGEVYYNKNYSKRSRKKQLSSIIKG
ncbi:glycosyltransferase family 4 protein [Olleya marilimosa]|uniref:glycosyltransferase family 4 protein n=1 Tax=Olleya marilimosa TaxID=272164 RepID=UPI00168D5553|nr:glycosyltransferase family 4 protein [Olleya marilimosa]MBD3891525.1 glycosyltransferase family 4 protein [Olleya marilimosa]